MNRKIFNRICCIALIGWFLWAMQLFCAKGTEGTTEAQDKNESSMRWEIAWERMEENVHSVWNMVVKGKGQEAIRKEGKTTSPVVVIDAGHGGMDPGKVGVSGALEKEINLAIAKELKELLEQNDITVVMTRTDDNGLYSDTDRNKKSADMQARIRLLAEASPVLAVSIHQNSFTDSQSRGAQVFYYESSLEGKRGAELIQETMKRELADGNHRIAKANTSYYMLKKSPCPLVIVECGFLSNPQEEQLLMTENYQRKVAWAVHFGVLEWVTRLQSDRK